RRPRNFHLLPRRHGPFEIPVGIDGQDIEDHRNRPKPANCSSIAKNGGEDGRKPSMTDYLAVLSVSCFSCVGDVFSKRRSTAASAVSPIAIAGFAPGSNSGELFR